MCLAISLYMAPMLLVVQPCAMRLYHLHTSMLGTTYASGAWPCRRRLLVDGLLTNL